MNNLPTILNAKIYGMSRWYVYAIIIMCMYILVVKRYHQRKGI